MITRRTFLIRARTALTLAVANKFTWHLDNFGTPLIEAPEDPTDILYVSRELDLQLNLSYPPDILPFITWGEFLTEYVECEIPTTLSGFRDLYYEWGVKPTEIDNDCEGWPWIEYWSRIESPNACAYRFLEDLGIGSEQRGKSNEIGGLKFIDGPMPGNDYLGVHANDELSVSLLQQRLNELGTGIAIEIID